MKVSSNDRYTILNFKKGEVRLFHHDLEQHPIINPKYQLKKKSGKNKIKILEFEEYYPFDYGCKEFCEVSVFLPEEFTIAVRREIINFNEHVRDLKIQKIKQNYQRKINQIYNKLKINLSHHGSLRDLPGRMNAEDLSDLLEGMRF